MTRTITLGAALLAAGLLSACASDQPMKMSMSQIAATPCSDMIKAGSALSQDVGDLNNVRSCAHGTDASGHNVMQFTADGPLPNGQIDPSPILVVILARYDENVTLASAQDVASQNGMSTRHLDGPLTANVGGQNIPAEMFREDDQKSGVSIGCVYAAPTGQRGTPTKVVICRSAGVNASDDLVKRTAEQIASADFPAVNP